MDSQTVAAFKAVFFRWWDCGALVRTKRVCDRPVDVRAAWAGGQVKVRIAAGRGKRNAVILRMAPLLMAFLREKVFICRRRDFFASVCGRRQPCKCSRPKCSNLSTCRGKLQTANCNARVCKRQVLACDAASSFSQLVPSHPLPEPYSSSHASRVRFLLLGSCYHETVTAGVALRGEQSNQPQNRLCCMRINGARFRRASEDASYPTKQVVGRKYRCPCLRVPSRMSPSGQASSHAG
jgi:hypothetical protein